MHPDSYRDNAKNIVGFALIYLYVNPIRFIKMSNTVGPSEASRPGLFFPAFLTRQSS